MYDIVLPILQRKVSNGLVSISKLLYIKLNSSFKFVSLLIIKSYIICSAKICFIGFGKLLFKICVLDHTAVNYSNDL